MRRRGSHSLLAPGITALVLASALAGCAGGDGAKAADSGDVVVDGFTIAAGRVLVDGTVYNDAGLVIPKARVSILGSDNYTDSDERGNFRFVNVTAGNLELQASHPSYQSHVHKVTAAPGSLIRLNLTMLPKDSLGVETPHTHDHWAGLPTYVLFDADINLQTPPQGTIYPDAYWTVYNAAYKPNGVNSPWQVPLAETPNGGPALVLPGTERLTFKLTWSGDTIRTEGFGFCYRSANRDPQQCLPALPTSPATWEVTVRPDMADSGHQAFTLWSLQFYVVPMTQSGGGGPDITYGSVRAHVELHKGEVFVDPPHPKFWEAGNERPVMLVTETRTNNCCSIPGPWQPDDLVPPGTSRLRIDHQWVIEGAGGSTPWEYRLAVRNAQMSPYIPQGAWPQPAPTGGSAAEKHYIYEFEVNSTETDGHYQRSSFWRFTPFQPRWGPEGYEIAGFPVKHIVTITAIRDP